MTDTHKGDDAGLIESINAAIELNRDGALTPRIPTMAIELLTSAAIRLARATDDASLVKGEATGWEVLPKFMEGDGALAARGAGQGEAVAPAAKPSRRMTMTADLIARLEAATAGSRLLDAMVAVAVRGGSDPQPDGRYKRVGTDFWRENSKKVTALIDSAVGLVKAKIDNVEWSVSEDESRAVAWVNGSKAWATTPALALSAALLRALSKEGEHG